MRKDLSTEIAEINGNVVNIRKDLSAKIADVHKDLSAEIADKDMEHRFEKVKTQITDSRRR